MKAKPTRLGSFHEALEWKIAGSAEFLLLHIKGISRSPGFLLTPKMLSFGDMATGFSYEKTATLQNKSRIPFAFEFRHDAKDVRIVPHKGSLSPSEETEIIFTVSPLKARTVSEDIEFRMEGIDIVLQSLQLKGKARAASLEFAAQAFDLGKIFLGHPYSTKIGLKNVSDVLAGFRIESDTETAKIRSIPENGTLRAKASTQLRLEVVPKRTGSFSMTIPVETAGEIKNEMEIQFQCVGPAVRLSCEDNRFGIQPFRFAFGRISVLDVHKTLFHLTNPCPISAKIFLSLKENDGFQVTPNEMQLDPGTTRDFVLSACLDEATAFKDALEIEMAHGTSLKVHLTAEGQGSTLLCPLLEKIENLDFGTLYLKSETTRDVVVENRGRKPVLVNWNCVEKQHKTKTGRSKAFQVNLPSKLCLKHL